MSAVSCRFFQVTYGDIDKKVCTQQASCDYPYYKVHYNKVPIIRVDRVTICLLVDVHYRLQLCTQ